MQVLVIRMACSMISWLRIVHVLGYIGWCILENVQKSLQSQKGSCLSEIIPRPVTIHWNIKPGYMCHFHHKLSNNIWSNFNVVVVYFWRSLSAVEWMTIRCTWNMRSKQIQKNSYSIESGIQCENSKAGANIAA